MLWNRAAVMHCLGKLNVLHFANQQHQAIFQAIESLYANYEDIDIVSVCDKLQELKALEIVGGRAYLLEAARERPEFLEIPQLIDDVSQLRIRRQVRAASDIRDDAAEQQAN